MYTHFLSYINENSCFKSIEQYLKEQSRSLKVFKVQHAGLLKGYYLLKIVETNPAPINLKLGWP